MIKMVSESAKSLLNRLLRLICNPNTINAQHASLAESTSPSRSRDKKRLKILVVVAVLLLLWGVALRNSFNRSGSFALFQDNEFFMGPVLSAMSTMLGHGEWPLRMDNLLGGIPLYNFTQLSVFYPFYFIFLPIYSTPFAIVHSLHWIVLVHLFITQVNTYVFLRVIRTSRIGSVTGACLVAFSANSFAYASWFNIIAPYAWFPLYLAGLVGVLRDPESLRYSAAALLAVVLLTFASPSQPLIHTVFCTGIFVSAFLIAKVRSHHTATIREPLTRLCIIGVLAVMLTAPAIVPTLLSFKDMIRWVGPVPAVVGNAKIPFSAFEAFQLRIYELSGMFFQIKGVVVGSAFVGVIPFALASVAVVSRFRSWLVLALTFIAIYSLTSSAGSNLGLLYINYHLPLLNKIREPSRFLVLFQFSIGVLAAIGLDEISSARGPHSYAGRRQLLALSATVIAAITFLIRFYVHVSDIGAAVGSIIALLLLIILTSMRSNARATSRYKHISIMWAFFAGCFLLHEVPWIPPQMSSRQFLTENDLALDQVIAAVAARDPARQYRVLFDGKLDKQKAAMLASYHNVRVLNFYFNPAPYEQFQQLYYFQPRDDGYFRALGAKYLICFHCTPDLFHGYNLIDSKNGYQIFEADNVSPQAYITTKVDNRYADWQDFARSTASASLKNGVLSVSQFDVAPLVSSDQAARAVCIDSEEERSSNYLRFTVQCGSPGVLVVNEFYDGQWLAFVDGIKVGLMQVNGNQLGLPFKAGSHVLEFDYLPRSFSISLGIMVLGGIVTGLFFYVNLKKAKKDRPVCDAA